MLVAPNCKLKRTNTHLSLSFLLLPLALLHLCLRTMGCPQHFFVLPNRPAACWGSSSRPGSHSWCIAARPILRTHAPPTGLASSRTATCRRTMDSTAHHRMQHTPHRNPSTSIPWIRLPLHRCIHLCPPPPYFSSQVPTATRRRGVPPRHTRHHQSRSPSHRYQHHHRLATLPPSQARPWPYRHHRRTSLRQQQRHPHPPRHPFLAHPIPRVCRR